MSSTKVHWIATISDGTVAVENQGEFQIIEGQRKPFVRLIQKLETEGKYITSFRLQIGKRTIHLPRLKNNRFVSISPQCYSLCYHYEADDILGNMTEKHFINLGAHYKDFSVHYIQDITEGNNSWITVTDNNAPAKSPYYESKDSQD